MPSAAPNPSALTCLCSCGRVFAGNTAETLCICLEFVSKSAGFAFKSSLTMRPLSVHHRVRFPSASSSLEQSPCWSASSRRLESIINNNPENVSIILLYTRHCFSHAVRISAGQSLLLSSNLILHFITVGLRCVGHMLRPVVTTCSLTPVFLSYDGFLGLSSHLLSKSLLFDGLYISCCHFCNLFFFFLYVSKPSLCVVSLTGEAIVHD